MPCPNPFALRSLRAILARIQTLPVAQPVGPTVFEWCRLEGVDEVTADTLSEDAYAAVLNRLVPLLGLTSVRATDAGH